MIVRKRVIVLVWLVVILPQNAQAGVWGFPSSIVGRSLDLAVSDEQIEATPKWDAAAMNPPLSARDALTLADQRKQDLVGDQDEVGWSFQSLCLCPASDDHWFWIAHYAPRGADQHPSAELLDLSVVVLMDGSVPEHTISGRVAIVTPDDVSDFVAAAPVEQAAFEYLSYSSGRNVIVSVQTNDLKRTPRWEVTANHPPLSARRALDLANVRKAAILRDDERFFWELDCICLARGPGDHWLWEAHYNLSSKVVFGTGIRPWCVVIVLMDGTVPEHVETDRDPLNLVK